MQAQKAYELIDQNETLGPSAPIPRSRDDVKKITGELRHVPVDVLLRGRIDREYHFKELGPCGRQGCPQSHGWGYIVAIPGCRYVSIGHNCRDSLGSDRWDHMVRDFEARSDAEAKQATITTLIENATSRRALHSALHKNAAQCSQLIAAFRRQLRGGVLAEIQRRADKNEPRVEHHASISKARQDAHRAIVGGGRVDKVDDNIRVTRYEVTHLGDLVGLGSFVASRDPLSQWSRLGSLLDAVAACEGRLEERELILATIRAAKDIGPWSQDLLDSLRECDSFFSDRNLDLVVQLPVARSQGIQLIRVDHVGGMRVVVAS